MAETAKKEKLGIMAHILKFLNMDDEAIVRKNLEKLIKSWNNSIEIQEHNLKTIELGYKKSMMEYENQRQEASDALKEVWVLSPDELKELKPTGFADWEKKFNRSYDVALETKDSLEVKIKKFQASYEETLNGAKGRIAAVKLKVTTATEGIK
tara:strand:- start:1829 stop:2287 length:459 start_codon:yes stop_codon:yes gene_type:complete